ncbi:MULTISPECIES: hypothetical protein [Shewanella]|uniref:hypothetical protein n=1 Tax=Shewanella TaxID=22 RepID=UPI000C33EAD8|nr:MULTISPECIES: hypothetical protein [Shewanella]MCL1155389.1 hypothetical protein [Shewanella chilikensis]GGZ38238.1 hypothetical protein GCM10007105_26650 [Shewanella chilikensis]HCD12573.1 hypothetical protein [Shewanella sp.]HDS1212166.1 hypothetical protein [Shewanella algae]
MKRYAGKKGKRWLECYTGHNKPTDMTLKQKTKTKDQNQRSSLMPLLEPRDKQGHQAAKR